MEGEFQKEATECETMSKLMHCGAIYCTSRGWMDLQDTFFEASELKSQKDANVLLCECGFIWR